MKTREMVLQLRDQARSVYDHTLQKAYFRVFGHQVDGRFAIVGNARTGSNYLLDGLKTSPAIRMYHEIFAAHNREVGKDFEKTLSAVFQNESRSTRLVGFKVFYNHLTEQEWAQLAALEDLKVIHLTRRNRLRTIISLEIAFKTGQWTRSGKPGASQEKRVALDPSRLIQHIEQIEAGEAATRLRFCERSILEVVYEELIRSPEEVFSLVGAYLGVGGIDPGRIRLKRQNPESLAELIVNYNEVEAVLRTTRFSDYLKS
jgi:LPS sulfotransferase NodH